MKDHGICEMLIPDIVEDVIQRRAATLKRVNLCHGITKKSIKAGKSASQGTMYGCYK